MTRLHPRRESRAEAPHVPFVLTGLAFAIFGGFALAVVLPLEAALGVGTRSWVAHAQVHGHLQAVGFVALMVVGVSYHLLPAFEGRPIALERLTKPSLYLLAGGVLARVFGQPLANHDAFAALTILGAAAELSGALCFAAIIWATLWPGLRRRDASAPFFLTAAFWLSVQALLGVWWVADMALRGSTAIPASRDSVLVALQLVGFDVMFILGVGVRSFPVFFGAGRFPFRTVAVPFALWQVGLAAIVARGFAVALAPAVAWVPASVGLLGLGVGVIWVAARTGWWHPPSRMRPASRPFAVPLQMALAWLSLAGVLFLWLAVEAVAGRTLSAAYRMDAVLHLIAVGVVLTTIVAMGQLVLPEFASERFEGRQGAWRGIALGGLLSLATVLRAGSRWASDWLPAVGVNLAMSAAGLISMAVMVTFALLYVRGIRNHRALLARFAAMQEQSPSWTASPAEGPSRGRSA